MVQIVIWSNPLHILVRGRFDTPASEKRISRRFLGHELGKQGMRLLLAGEAAVGMLEIGFAQQLKAQVCQARIEAFSKAMAVLSLASSTDDPQLQEPLDLVVKNHRLDLEGVISQDYEVREKAFVAVYRFAKPLVIANRFQLNAESSYRFSDADVEQVSRYTAYAGSQIGESNDDLSYVDRVFGLLDDIEIARLYLVIRNTPYTSYSFQHFQATPYKLFKERFDYVCTLLLR